MSPDGPGLPRLPAGCTARTPDPAADAPALDAVLAAFAARYAAPHSQPAAQALGRLGASLRDGGAAVLVDHRDGGTAGPAALAWVDVRDRARDTDREPTLALDVRVAPPHTGPLEAPLVTWCLDRVRQWLAADGRAAVRVESDPHREDRATTAAMAGAGLVHDRTYWRMERPHPAAGSDAGSGAPPGVTVRRVTDDTGRRLVHRLWLTSFADHHGFEPLGFDEWWTRWERRGGTDLTQWWVADLDGEPVGHCIGDARLATLDGGYVRSLGVDPAARGRGVARHLLGLAFAEHVRRGWTFTQLFVDAGNETGATQLYRSVGMVPVEVKDEYAARIVAEPTTRVPS
ncbi:MAG: GNAT family N-acetyltransferase [Actinobacteria bacterium]|nr:GNAT family N-acetyltransferase [Actinomycetota bacterium]